jgi:hypothetical protein
MSHLVNPFRLAHRSFDRVVFDRVKSDNVFTLRGFDLACASHVFPGYVLERPASPHPAEARFQVLAELAGTVLLLVYARLGRTGKLLTGWVANADEAALWFGGHAANGHAANGSLRRHELRGRSDPHRFGKHHPDDSELRPEIAPADLAASAAELSALRERMAAALAPAL